MTQDVFFLYHYQLQIKQFSLSTANEARTAVFSVMTHDPKYNQLNKAIGIATVL